MKFLSFAEWFSRFFLVPIAVISLFSDSRWFGMLYLLYLYMDYNERKSGRNWSHCKFSKKSGYNSIVEKYYINGNLELIETIPAPKKES